MQAVGDDAARSERGTFIGLHHWMKSSSVPALRRRAADKAEWVADALGLLSEEERALYTPERLDRISAEMERLGQAWHEAGVGQSIEVEWPSSLRANAPVRRKRRV